MSNLVSGLLIILFLYAAITRTFHINTITEPLQSTPVFRKFPTVAAWAIVCLEYIISVLLFFPPLRRAGLYASLVLMTCFTCYVGYMILFIPKLPCSCGVIIAGMTWTEQLFFNLLITLIAFATILLQRKNHIKT